MKKIYLIILAIFVAGGVLVSVKWNTWFRNPAEAVYSTPMTPDRIMLSTGEDLETSRRVSWRCDTVVTPAHIEVIRENMTDTQRIDASGTMVASRSGKSAFYRAEILDVQPNQGYQYRVANGNVYSPWYTFRTAGKDAPMSFIYIGDVQDKENGTTGELFDEVHKKYPDVDFWAFGGDAIERPTDVYWSHWYSSIDSIAPTKPILAATGNHEYLKGIIKTLDSRWTHTFSFPENGPEDFKGRSYYVNFKDLCYIVIDTDGIQGLSSIYAHRNWLEGVLASSDKKWKIIMMHHPIYSVRAGRINILTRYAFKSIIENSSINMVLQGHDHGYSRIAMPSSGQLECPVYVVSNNSPKFYNIGFAPEHDRLGSGIRLYQHITITGDSLHFKAYTDEHELYDYLTISADGHVVDHAKEIPEKLDLPPSYAKKGSKFADEYNQQKQEYIERKKH